MSGSLPRLGKPQRYYYLHSCSFNRDSFFILDEALDTSVSLAEEEEEGGAVVVPELGKLLGRRVLAARQLDGDLHAPVPDVVVVLVSRVLNCVLLCP
jgi:hypothetical protein